MCTVLPQFINAVKRGDSTNAHQLARAAHNLCRFSFAFALALGIALIVLFRLDILPLRRIECQPGQYLHVTCMEQMWPSQLAKFQKTRSKLTWKMISTSQDVNLAQNRGGQYEWQRQFGCWNAAPIDAWDFLCVGGSDSFLSNDTFNIDVDSGKWFRLGYHFCFACQI